MWVPANQVAAIPKGREDNTHLNVHGGRIVAGLAMDAIAKEVPELAKYVRHYDFVVAQDGSGDFFTVQEAIDAVPDFRKNIRTTILVRKGVYKEKIVVPESKINISLIGQEGAILSYDDYAQKKNCFGGEKGTSGSSSCYIYAPDFYAENITFENSSGPVGQAVACFVSADRAFFKNCRFLGFQDTLYTYGKDVTHYQIDKQSEYSFWFHSLADNIIKLHKSEDPNDTLAFSFKSVEIIPTYTEVTKKDSVVMFDGVRYRAYVYINPSQMKVVKTTYSEDGISMDNIYYDNVMHICVYEGKKSLYAKDITKQMFVDVIPTDFLQQAILSDMNFTGIDRKGYHYQALVCIPESPVCNLVNLTISFDGKLNITAAKYK